MTSQVDEIKSFINDRLDDCERTLDLIQKYGPQAIRAYCNIYLRPIAPFPGQTNPVAELLVERLLAFIAYARQVLEIHRLMVKMLGSPDALNAAAEQLGANVAGVTKTMSVAVTEDSLDALLSSNWAGDGSELYARSFSGQHDSVVYISEVAGKLKTALHSLADEIFSFYSGVVGLVISLEGLIISIVLICTGVASPVGIVGAIVSLIGLGVNCNQLFVKHGQTMDGIKRNLPGELIPWSPATFAT